MPMVTVRTNVSKDKAPETFHKDFTDLVVNELTKPREVVWVTLEADKLLTKGGTSDPTALVSIECIGRFKPQVNIAFGKKVEEYLEKNLGIPKNRTAIRFIRIPSLFTFHNGKLNDPAQEFDEDI